MCAWSLADFFSPATVNLDRIWGGNAASAKAMLVNMAPEVRWRLEEGGVHALLPYLSR